MSYTEKVSLSGTALSFLLYECINSVNTQEGFLIGDVTSEITNHISDSHSDNARLDTQISIKTALPLPSVAMFYMPTGRIKEDVLKNLLSNISNEVVGWYKYRKNNSLKPTFRDKLITKGLQKYFEKHSKKTFVTCILSSKTSSAASTHAFTYRFGKINCFDMYEYIEDVTANLGEKVTGYKKVNRTSVSSIFNKIIQESNIQCNSPSEAILHIQEAVDIRLRSEAKLAATNESTIRELEAEIRQMNAILSDKHAVDLQSNYEKALQEKFISREAEMADAYIEALQTPSEVDILSEPNVLMNASNNHNLASDSDNSVQIISDLKERSTSPELIETSLKKPALNYAAALKNNSEPSTSKKNNFSEDLISFDVDDKLVKSPAIIKDNVKCLRDSSPEY